MIIYLNQEIQISLATGTDYCAEEEEKFKAVLVNNAVRFKREETKYTIHAQKCSLPEYAAMDVLSALCIEAKECRFRFHELGELAITFEGYKE